VVVFLVVPTALALWGVVATIVVMARDGYRRLPVDPGRETGGRREPGASGIADRAPRHSSRSA